MNKIAILIAALAFVVFAIYLAVEHAKNDISQSSHGSHTIVIDSERAFFEHMIPHHEEAVVAANLLLQKGSTLRPLTELAEDIVASQTTEIDQMKEWYQTWYGLPYEMTAKYAPMMRPLTELSGVEFERVFIEDMILHHEVALSTAEAVLKLSISVEAEAFAKSIINAQEVEIIEMRELLRLLPE